MGTGDNAALASTQIIAIIVVIIAIIGTSVVVVSLLWSASQIHTAYENTKQELSTIQGSNP